MSFGTLPQCLRCIYLHDPVPEDPDVQPTCDAFPDGIPAAVWSDDVPHNFVLTEFGQKNTFTFIAEEGFEAGEEV